MLIGIICVANVTAMNQDVDIMKIPRDNTSIVQDSISEVANVLNEEE